MLIVCRQCFSQNSWLKICVRRGRGQGGEWRRAASSAWRRPGTRARRWPGAASLSRRHFFPLRL